MKIRTPIGLLGLLIATALAGCNRTDGPPPIVGPTPVPPSAPQPAPIPTPAVSRLVAFTDPDSGVTTSDVRDAQDHVVQFSSAGELIWTADGTRIRGYALTAQSFPYWIPAELLCGCWLEIRFGTRDGQRVAYLTADYGHDNPGTLVTLTLTNGVLALTKSHLYPPGTSTLSGVITEMTPTGPVPVEGVDVYRLYRSGHQIGTTDRDGFYRIQGLYPGTEPISAIKQGYETHTRTVALNGDTRLDIQLVRR